MAKQKISYEPQVLDLILYAGDGSAFNLIVTDSLKVPVNLTGEMIAHIRKDRDTTDQSAEFEVDLTDAVDGIALLRLTGDVTQGLITEDVNFIGVWDVQWTPSGDEPMTLCQGKVECIPDVSR